MDAPFVIYLGICRFKLAKQSVSWHIQRAKEVISTGGVIAYPTEAVWGLGCDPWNERAVERLLQLKSRPKEKGLILISGHQTDFDSLILHVTDQQKQQLNTSWPGPFSWVIEDPDQWVPEWVRGHFSSVAVRVTDHPLVCELCKVVGHPIVSTSANPAGHPPAKSHLQVRRYFQDQLDYILPGQLGGRKQPSVIRILQTGKILRS